MSDLEFNLIHRWNIADTLRRSAARYPNHRALHYQGHNLSYRELDALSNKVARLLESAGIRRGDNVAILSFNSPEFVATLYGCARLGAALVPIHLMFTPQDVDYALQKTRIRALLVDPALEAKLNRHGSVVPSIGGQFRIDDEFRRRVESMDDSPVERFVASDDAATIVFTSGTTARPKAVVNTHLNWYATILSGVTDIRLSRAERSLLALPMFHVGGLNLTIAAIFLGAEAVIIPGIRPDLIVRAIVEQNVTSIAFPATSWIALLQQPGIETIDFSGVRFMLVFQYLPTPVFNRWRELVPHARWVNYYGQSETVPAASTPPEENGGMLGKPDPIGFPHTPIEFRIVDHEMRDVPDGQVGGFFMRGPSITPGYFDDPEANQELFRGGWHHTGNMGYRDPEGCLYFVDRQKDMIKSGGENVSSQEVEEVLAKHPGVAEVAVVGLRDPYWIERVVAAVVPHPGVRLAEHELIAFAKQRLAGYKVPKQIVVMNELPKNPAGKVLKRVLRQQLDTTEANRAGGAS